MVGGGVWIDAGAHTHESDDDPLFAAVFAGLGLGTTAGDRGSAVLMVCGVFLGSALWWLLLSGAVGFFRRALTLERLRWVNRLSGALLTGFGVLSLLSLVP